MGKPILEAARIPVLGYQGTIINQPLTIGGIPYGVTCVSMGNPHCVVFQNDVDGLELEKIGTQFEHHPMFPESVNTEFVETVGTDEVKMRVWERGSGETWACGTGACAVAVACVLNGKTGRRVLVHLKGGDLVIDWDETSGNIRMKGPAEFVFDGKVEI